MKQKKILFVGPIPPPVDGQSKATLMSLNAIRSMNVDVEVVNLNRDGLNRGVISQLKRLIFDVPKILSAVIILRSGSSGVYISISESVLGNIKDMVIYSLLIGKLNKTTIHMLGGSGMNRILNDMPFLSFLNGLFMRHMRCVIIEGPKGKKIFSKFFEKKRIRIIPNFYEDYLNCSDAEVVAKYASLETVNILYLSNMIIEKGYKDLLTAYMLLPIQVRQRVILNFVGGFPTSTERSSFLDSISELSGVNFLGDFIDGEEKRKLYLNSHIFCLPTYYPYEGQPISILEAYAAGCFVLTTLHGGIGDIFADEVNGFQVEARSPSSIANAIERSISDFGKMHDIGIHNIAHAKLNYSTDMYCKAIGHHMIS